MLQQQLEEIRNNNYIIDNTLHIDSLSSSMLEHIGVTDSYLRDKLIYSTFYHLIKKEYLLHTQLQKLLLALHELVTQLPVKKQTLHIESYEYLYGNIKSFLRSLFFRLRTLSICEETECEVEKLLQELPKYY
ncbi:hypothetical protein P4U05_09710 [Bacillus paranthracis]|uniref:hypothetical protein n=1 Tax=Bacillus cereus group TaxID=86661 RepID=UPI000200F354|nr:MULTISPECIES: hypothetical protein [Bacillus cereus group]ADY23769.1 hypothetical protein YBT020_22705 [Bacillus thuringiensis serovar finitimus YBT-020]MRC73388.1 hypothetical protein [Bacillus thuringiensis]OTX76641.1 hypothetical protein BK722_04235 [Bacillus thuringiensis serovar finitimus]MBG9909079.1 hypothetical protein [Bacillus paranthracis]MCR6796075.1 hypothetical protein [Bacillus paranthracis]